ERFSLHLTPSLQRGGRECPAENADGNANSSKRPMGECQAGQRLAWRRRVRPCVVRSSEKMVEAGFGPATDARHVSRTAGVLASVHDVAQRLQALGEEPRRLAVTVGVVAGARTMVVAQR